MLASWPVLGVIGDGPTPAQKISSLGDHSFCLNILARDDFYTLYALSKSPPSEVWMLVVNSMADAAFTNAFGAWSVFAHVNDNRGRCGNGYFRNVYSTDVDFQRFCKILTISRPCLH